MSHGWLLDLGRSTNLVLKLSSSTVSIPLYSLELSLGSLPYPYRVHKPSLED